MKKDYIIILFLIYFSLSIGDNIIIGSYDKKLCWFDLDLSSRPYRTLWYLFILKKVCLFYLNRFFFKKKFICSYHTKAIRNVVYHKRLPLFASCSDDGTIQIFHGMVYNDFLQNPLIVPVKILKSGHQVVDSLGDYINYYCCNLLSLEFSKFLFLYRCFGL
jgi:ribosome biogenesis protein ERB1